MKNFKTRVIAVAVALGTFALTGLVIAGPADAANCTYDKWGSSKWSGQKFNCYDGQSLTIRPPFGSTDGTSNSFGSSPGRDSQGNNYRCTYGRYSGWVCK
jgi:hypothetical protein